MFRRLQLFCVESRVPCADPRLACSCVHINCRIGMKAGFTMRQQVVAAIHAKVLRLNSAAVGHANIGRIINLARCAAAAVTGQSRQTCKSAHVGICRPGCCNPGSGLGAAAPAWQLCAAPTCTMSAAGGTPVSVSVCVCHERVVCCALHSCRSNDVRRFDDGISFWLFVWAGPLEAALVLMMVSLELGFVPAVCGMAAMLAVIPIQVGRPGGRSLQVLKLAVLLTHYGADC